MSRNWPQMLRSTIARSGNSAVSSENALAGRLLGCRRESRAVLIPSTPRALVVAPTPAVAERLVTCLQERGFRTSLVTDFRAARQELDVHPPALLVTEIRLGAFNGLHLTLRARARFPEMPAIVVGDADCVLEAEARMQHVPYVGPFDEGAFIDSVCSARAASIS